MSLHVAVIHLGSGRDLDRANALTSHPAPACRQDEHDGEGAQPDRHAARELHAQLSHDREP